MSAPNIYLLGAVYPEVSGVTLPKQGGGTASFPWVEGSETKTANGTYDVTNLAQLIVNVAGGGGSGLVYETGEYKPSADVAQPTINFSNSHTNRPFIVIMQDMGGSSSIATQNSILLCAMISWYDFFGYGVWGTANSANYAKIQYIYKSSSALTSSTATITSLTGTTSSSMPYWLSNTSFKPGAASTSRYWRRNRTYKWIAVWKPTT